MYIVNAIDISKEAKILDESKRKTCIPKDANDYGGLLKSIKLGIGSTIMLRRNINTSSGLVNGALGVVRGFQWPALRRDQLEEGELPQAVLVQSGDTTIPTEVNGCVRIKPVSVTFDGLKGFGKIERTMIPLILCWAVTVHKVQGVTLDKAVVYLGSHLFAKAQACVALSRVRTLAGLAISELDGSEHFGPECYEIPLKNRLMGYVPVNLRTLKSDAIPTLCVPRDLSA